MPQPERPRKGSLGFGPRTRSASETPRFNSWPDDDGQPSLQGFAGYKAGMTHVVMINDEPDSAREGMEETVPVTVVETPPLQVVALRAYEDTPYGKRPLTELWVDEPHPDLDRALDLPEESNADAAEEQIRDALEAGTIGDIRAITHTVPEGLDGVPKKRPDVMENRVGGGSMDERLEYGIELLEDGTYAVNEVFRAGEYADVAGITKGKGTEGPVKRWGVQKRKGKHARQGWRRRIGNLGPWNPSRVRSTVPQQGQTGYHQRTELNKRLIDIADDADDIGMDGGFLNYGEVGGSYALVKGSVPGPEKRLVRLRPAVRPKDQPRLDPEVRYVSTASNQG
jgi:large subunit ribosomal protein L3